MKNYAQAMSILINGNKKPEISEEYSEVLEKLVNHQELSIREKNILAMERGVPFVPNPTED